MLNVTVLVGNPKPASRTLQVATTLVQRLLSPETYAVSVIDLAEYSAHIFEWPSDRMAELNESVARSDLLVIATPTYKATYSGQLKGFLDRYPNLGLNGVVTIPVMTGASLAHSMGPEVHLRPLLVELGAVVPTQGLYFVIDHMDRLESVIDGWVHDNAERLRRLPPLTTAVLSAHPKRADES